ncbi:MAG: hypothetical protein ABI972_19675 [Acidobacteriota bacterium]
MLHTVTSYFNPARYRSRLANYRAFRRHLRGPLVTVELSFDGQFELDASDATQLIQVLATDVMFQKERLLNLAVGALPGDCDAVAWVDCDVILSEDWASRATKALRTSRLVQLYERQFNLTRDGIGQTLFGTSVARKFLSGEMTLNDFTAGAMPVPQTAWGLAWAAPRQLLDEHHLYDSCIAGSGDAALFCAAVGGFDRPTEALRMSADWHRHYLAWARPFHAAIAGRIGCLDGPVQHLWHGEMEHRQYRQRHQHLQQFQFNPATDIALTGNGCWRWNSEKPEMQAWIAAYLRGRREDGD